MKNIESLPIPFKNDLYLETFDSLSRWDNTLKL